MTPRRAVRRPPGGRDPHGSLAPARDCRKGGSARPRCCAGVQCLSGPSRGYAPHRERALEAGRRRSREVWVEIRFGTARPDVEAHCGVSLTPRGDREPVSGSSRPSRSGSSDRGRTCWRPESRQARCHRVCTTPALMPWSRIPMSRARASLLPGSVASESWGTTRTTRSPMSRRPLTGTALSRGEPRPSGRWGRRSGSVRRWRRIRGRAPGGRACRRRFPRPVPR